MLDNSYAKRLLRQHGFGAKTLQEIHDTARRDMKNAKLPFADRDRAR